MLSDFILYVKYFYNNNLNHYFEKAYTGFTRYQRDLGTKTVKIPYLKLILKILTSNHFASWLKSFTGSRHWPHQSTNSLRMYTRHILVQYILEALVSLQPSWNTLRTQKASYSSMPAFVGGREGESFWDALLPSSSSFIPSLYLSIKLLFIIKDIADIIATLKSSV